MKYYFTLLISLIAITINGQCVEDCVTDATRYGAGAGLNNTGPQVSIFGRSAGLNNTGDLNSFFGFNAGRNSIGGNNSFFGHKTGIENITGNSNSFFGFEVGKSNESGSANSFFGSFSGHENISGVSNCFFGSLSGRDNENGNNNSFYGTSTGLNNISGGANCFFGLFAGEKNVSGNSNCFYGLDAGRNNVEGSRNSYFGVSAGNNLLGSYNIAIGHNAGPFSAQGNADSSLYIDVERTDEPLIYGQFNKRIVRINGSFEAMGGIANSSDVHRKEEVYQIDETSILKKLSQLEISEWSYKDDEGVRHIGPMAQDFYKAFGLGKRETTISTIDADGVALAAIQALYKLLDKERQINQEQKIINDSLLKRLSAIEAQLEN